MGVRVMAVMRSGSIPWLTKLWSRTLKLLITVVWLKTCVTWAGATQ